MRQIPSLMAIHHDSYGSCEVLQDCSSPQTEVESLPLPQPLPGVKAKNIVWLRRDLRLKDNNSLAAALASGGQTAVAFVFDVNILAGLKRDDRRVSFICESLGIIQEDLRAYGSDLFILQGDPKDEIPLLALMLGASQIFAGKDYEPYACVRDEKVSEHLKSQGASLSLVLENPVVAPESFDNSLISTFSRFKKDWERSFFSTPPIVHDCSNSESHFLPCLPNLFKTVDASDVGFEIFNSWNRIGITPGESAAIGQFSSFLHRVPNYHFSRDNLRSDSGSSLSPYFRFGLLNPTAAALTAHERHGVAALPWLNEICWRDWCFFLAYRKPDLLAGSTFNPTKNELDWPGSDRHFEAWKNGMTGYPLVDAGMRELMLTGRLSNRMRMICASFLSKHLLCDWKKGEQWFAETLLDYDAALNVMNWQWCAGVGCDAQPWFRMFSPLLQAKKYDPDGKYIRKWVPELVDIPIEFLFDPSSSDLLGFSDGLLYPKPIVDHAVARQKAMTFISK